MIEAVKLSFPPHGVIPTEARSDDEAYSRLKPRLGHEWSLKRPVLGEA